MRAPLVVPALLLLDAIVTARDGSAEARVALAVIALAACVFGRTQAHVIAACSVCCGLTLATWRSAPAQLAVPVERATISGVVVSDVASRDWGDSFEIVAVDGARYAASVQDRVAAGDDVVLQGRLEPFDAPRNPGEPSQRDLARERGLVARIVDAHVVARRTGGDDWRALPARLRALAGATIHRLLGEPDATILGGMLYGARGALPPSLRAEFQDTGTVHVLVTAGLHLGVVAALVTFLFSRLGIARAPAAFAAIPLVWTYAALSGGHVPSLRAAVMATVALLARALGERAISINNIAAAAMVVAAIWPAWVGGASFGLSFSCVTAIALFAEHISATLERLRVPAPLREALALTLSTQIGVWPLTASTFLVIAPYAALANLFVVPVVGVALIGGIALLATAPLPLVSVAMGRIEAWPLAWIENAVHLTASLPYAHVTATPPPDWCIAVYDAAMIAAALLLRANGRSPGYQP